MFLGIGLDDTFIIAGAYFRRLREIHAEKNAQRPFGTHDRLKDCDNPSCSDTKSNQASVNKNDAFAPRKQEEDRVVQLLHDTLEEVGLSISMTTLTTALAFVLGCTSTVPGIRWLCIYASVTVVFDFVYQATFFIALVALDERRVAGTLLKDYVSGQYPAWFQCFIKYCCCCWRCCCCCCHRWCFGSQEDRDADPTEDCSGMGQIERELPPAEEDKEFFMDRFMRWYSDKLLRPAVKVVVIILFLVFFGLSLWSTTKLEQQFNIEGTISSGRGGIGPWRRLQCGHLLHSVVMFLLADYVPKDSYTQPFLQALDEYSNFVVAMGVYFRGVDQSDENIQRQMLQFVDDLSALPQVGQQPDFCWIKDMHKVLSEGDNAMEQIAMSSTLSSTITEAQAEQLAFLADILKQGNYTFEEKVDIVLNIPEIRDVYGEDIVRDEEGRITASRCYIYIRHLDLKDIKEQIDVLLDQRAVTLAQPINQLPENKDELPFFTFDDLYYYWQLVSLIGYIFESLCGEALDIVSHVHFLRSQYTVAVEELIFNTIWGVLAVCIIGFLLIPHWTAVFYVGPLMVMLYFYLLGTMQVCGIYINAVTYVTVVISIGLLVDFLMHILLRFLETKGTTRDAKVKETLETMGASMLLGGFTTWLGVIPMAFSSTKIFMVSHENLCSNRGWI